MIYTIKPSQILYSVYLSGICAALICTVYIACRISFAYSFMAFLSSKQSWTMDNFIYSSDNI